MEREMAEVMLASGNLALQGAGDVKNNDDDDIPAFQPSENETRDSTAQSAIDSSTVTDVWLDKQSGTNRCFFCKQRKSPADIETCEHKSPGRNCPIAEDYDYE